jgi:SEC-C motif-containing protein
VRIVSAWAVLVRQTGGMMNGPCPCGAGEAYGDCCGRFHRGEANAPTADALMRSRYTAFAVGDADYLRETWHPRTRPPQVTLPEGGHWTRLDVLARSGGGVFDSDGTIEFEAHYELGGQLGIEHQNSMFVRENRRWFYVSDVPSLTEPSDR